MYLLSDGSCLKEYDQIDLPKYSKGHLITMSLLYREDQMNGIEVMAHNVIP